MSGDKDEGGFFEEVLGAVTGANMLDEALPPHEDSESDKDADDSDEADEDDE
jgi:hypothetical protein